MARLALTRLAAIAALAGALVLSLPVADSAAFAAPSCCSLRLDSLPGSLVAGGGPASFSGAMVNETADRTLTRTVLVLTVKLSGLTPDRLRIERESPDSQWVTLPIEAAGVGLVKASDIAYVAADIAPGAVAGGRYRMVFAVGAPTGSASVTMEAYPADNRTAAGLLGRSGAYAIAVRPPAPPGPSATVAPQHPVPESRTGGLSEAADATGPGGGGPASGIPSSPAAAVDEQVTPASSASEPRRLNRFMSIGLGGLAAIVFVAGAGWWFARRRARW